jgi:predicted dehydrogenase
MTVNSAEREPLKVVIIGDYGHVECAFEETANVSGFEICGIAPGRPGEPMSGVSRLANLSASNPKVYSAYSEMFDDIEPDVALVTCQYSDHAQVACSALTRGIHVLSEKPLATNWKDFQHLRTTYLRGSSHLSALFTMRYTPEIYALASFVKAGGIGDVLAVQIQKSYKLGTRPGFFRSRSAHGGLIPWVGSHAIDLIGWLSNQNVASVRAWHSNPGTHDMGDLEMVADIHCSMDDGGFGSAHLDYLRPENARSHGDDRIRVVGATGVGEIQDGIVRVLLREGERRLPVGGKRNVLEDFVDQITGNGVCRVSATDAFSATRISLAARDSADRDTEIQLQSQFFDTL